MNFYEALLLLKQGNRIISRRDKNIFKYQWFSLDEEGLIICMGNPWTPTPDWLLQRMNGLMSKKIANITIATAKINNGIILWN